MKTLENTTIAELMVKELSNRNMLVPKGIAKFVPEILFKGVAAYLNSLELKSVLVHISAPVYGELYNTFMNVYFHRDDNEHKLKFYTIRTSEGMNVEEEFKDLDETIYLYNDKNAIKFLDKIAFLHGAIFMPIKDHTKEADNMLSTLACFIYAVENYLIATYDKNEDNTVEISGCVKAKLKLDKVSEHNELYFTTYEPLFDLKEIDELTTKVKDRLDK